MEENCTSYRELFPDPAMSPITYLPFGIIYTVMFFMGLVGNITIIHVTLRNRTLQTVQNMFILNLAISDIIVCLLSLPITPVTNIFKNWFFGALLCRIIPWAQGVSVFICTFSLGAIALDRYILVVLPHWRPLNKRRAMSVTLILWSLSVMVTSPYAFFMHIETYEVLILQKFIRFKGVCGVFCTENWPKRFPFMRRAYTMVVMFAQFVAPFVLMAFCYASIFARLRTRALRKIRKIDARASVFEQSGAMMSMDEESSKNGIFRKDSSIRRDGSVGSHEQVSTLLTRQEKDRQRLIQQTRRTTIILASMVVIFGLTWLPHNVISLIMEYDEHHEMFHLFGRTDLDMSYLIHLLTHCIAMTNIVSNPILYAWLNPTFRELIPFKKLFRKRTLVKRKRTITFRDEYVSSPNNTKISQVSVVPNRRTRSVTVDEDVRTSLVMKRARFASLPTTEENELPYSNIFNEYEEKNKNGVKVDQISNRRKILETIQDDNEVTTMTMISTSLGNSLEIEGFKEGDVIV